MKRYSSILLLIITLPAALEVTQANPEAKLRLWYRQPAENWFQAMPVGNGRLGAMVFGGVEKERIQLNENTVWSGNRSDFDREGAYKHLTQARKLLFDGKYVEAEALVGSEFMGERPIGYYQPLGDLQLSVATMYSPTAYAVEELELHAEVVLPPGQADPRITYTFTAKTAAHYAVAYCGAPAAPLSEVLELSATAGLGRAPAATRRAADA